MRHLLPAVLDHMNGGSNDTLNSLTRDRDGPSSRSLVVHGHDVGTGPDVALSHGSHPGWHDRVRRWRERKGDASLRGTGRSVNYTGHQRRSIIRSLAAS